MTLYTLDAIANPAPYTAFSPKPATYDLSALPPGKSLNVVGGVPQIFGKAAGTFHFGSTTAGKCAQTNPGVASLADTSGHCPGQNNPCESTIYPFSPPDGTFDTRSDLPTGAMVSMRNDINNIAADFSTHYGSDNLLTVHWFGVIVTVVGGCDLCVFTNTVSQMVFDLVDSGGGGSGGPPVVEMVGLPYPHCSNHHQFLKLTFLEGYQAGTDLDVLAPGIGPLWFCSVRPWSAYLGRLDGSILVLTDRDGVQIPDGTDCGTVAVWRMKVG